LYWTGRSTAQYSILGGTQWKNLRLNPDDAPVTKFDADSRL
jgi:hypothetical protein